MKHKTLSRLPLFIMFCALFAVLFGGRFFSLQGIQAQSNEATEKLLEEKIDSFFRKLSQSGTHFNPAFEELFREGNVSSKASSEAIENISKKYQELNNYDVGQYRSVEKVRSEMIGQDVFLMKYISKHDNAPVAWTFIFYRPPHSTGPQWNPIHVRFDTGLEAFAQPGSPWK